MLRTNPKLTDLGQRLTVPEAGIYLRIHGGLIQLQNLFRSLYAFAW